MKENSRFKTASLMTALFVGGAAAGGLASQFGGSNGKSQPAAALPPKVIHKRKIHTVRVKPKASAAQVVPTASSASYTPASVSSSTSGGSVSSAPPTHVSSSTSGGGGGGGGSEGRDHEGGDHKGD